MVVRPLVASAVVVLLSLNALPAHAQGAAGTIYWGAEVLGTSTSSDCSGPNLYSATTTAPTASEFQKAYYTLGGGAASCPPMTFRYTAAAPFTMKGSFTFDFFLGCDAATVGLPDTPLTRTGIVTVSVDGTAVGTADLADQVSCTSGLQEIKGTIDAIDAAVNSGSTVDVAVSFFVFNTPADKFPNLFFAVAGTSAPSGLTGPGIPSASSGGNVAVGPIVTYANITTASVDIKDSFVSARNATSNYNWTTTAPTVTVSVNASKVSAGSVKYAIVDGKGQTALTGTFTAKGAQSKAVSAPGKWTIRLEYTGFIGDMAVNIAAASAATQTATSVPTVTSTASSDGTGNATQTSGAATDSDTESEESTPGLGVAVALLLVVAVGARVRRRMA